MNLDRLHCNRLAKRALLGAILSVTSLGAWAASFDCAKARSTSERLVCSDPQLSALDDRLGALAAAGKKRAADPRAYQRALDAAWSVRQKCEDIACVQSWYARRIKALSNAQPESDASPNISPGAKLRAIGEELGFDIPSTREEFVERYEATGGKCGISEHLSSLKALSRSVESDCWSGTACPAPAASLRCNVLRTAYDSNGRIVLFTTMLSTAEANRAEGARNMGKVLDRFAAVGGSDIRSRDVRNGRVHSLDGSQGQIRLEAEVVATEEGKQAGTFSVAIK